MDLSKLPKLSQTDAPPPAENSQADVPQNPPLGYMPALQPKLGIGADIWFNTVIGLFVIYLGKQFGSFLIAKMTGRPFDSGVVFSSDGTSVPYFQVQNFQALSDAGIFFFGIVVLFEAMLKAWFGIKGRVPKLATGFGLVLANAVTILNIFVCIKLFSNQMTPMISVLAVAYGGYIIFDMLSIFRYRTV